MTETTQAPAEVGSLGGRPAPTRRGQRYFVPNGGGVDAYESLDGSTWTAVGGAAAIPSGTYVEVDGDPATVSTPIDFTVAPTVNGDPIGLAVKGAKTAFGPVTVDTAGNDLVLAADADRIAVVLVNTGSVPATLGPSGVVYGAGVVLGPLEGWYDDGTTDAWHGVTQSSSTTISGYAVAPA